ncbi:MAG TPA: ABC transporter ATP-binding protein, partial [Planctomicrobium sp.]|nr:ABC transporter ATP-binding protein [Planctomicrobium sp.]
EILFGEDLLAAAPQQPVHIPPHRRNIGVVFQDYALFPHLSVLSNVMFGMRGRRRSRRDRALDLLAMLGLRDLARRQPHTLSGGQQQRVALARTLAAAPRVVLLDEPFSNLDASLRETARRDVCQLLADQGVAAILVTHDREEALSLGRRVAVMHRGRLVQIGPPEEVYSQPVNAFVARFLGAAIRFQVRAAGTIADGPFGRLLLRRPVQGVTDVVLRPEQVTFVSPQDSDVTGLIVRREFRGPVQTVTVRIGQQTFPIVSDSRTAPALGETVGIQVSGDVLPFEESP